jgi:hypothetical protein
MNNYKKAKDLYQLILNNNGYGDFTMIWIISCLEDSLQAYDMDLITTEEEKETIANLIQEAWLDTDVNIGISKITDIIVENWQDLKEDEDKSETIQDLIIDEVSF